MWNTAEAFPNTYVINRGFGGSHISDVNHFYQETVRKYEPSKIFFYTGDNDIAADKTPEQVLEDFEAFVQRVHNDLPGAEIYYLPIKPSLARWDDWPRMQEANHLIKRYLNKKQKWDYVDTASPMLKPDGTLKSGIYLDDGLHINQKGYQLWNKAVQPYLAD